MWQSLSIAYRFKSGTPAVTLIAVASALIAAPIVIRVIATAAYLTDGYAVIAYFILVFATYHVVASALAMQ